MIHKSKSSKNRCLKLQKTMSMLDLRRFHQSWAFQNWEGTVALPLKKFQKRRSFYKKDRGNVRIYNSLVHCFSNFMFCLKLLIFLIKNLCMVLQEPKETVLRLARFICRKEINKNIQSLQLFKFRNFLQQGHNCKTI